MKRAFCVVVFLFCVLVAFSGQSLHAQLLLDLQGLQAANQSARQQLAADLPRLTSAALTRPPWRGSLNTSPSQFA